MKLNGMELGAAASKIISEHLKNPPATSPEKKKFIQECVRAAHLRNNNR